jgi:hypothetical protein
MSKIVQTNISYICDICGRILPSGVALSTGPTEWNPAYYEVTMHRYYADKNVMDSCESCQRALHEFIKSRKVAGRNAEGETP